MTTDTSSPSISTDAVQKYAQVMSEIKRRSRVIDHFMSGRGAVLYVPTTVETIGLQFRKIFELIALGSLAANKKIYNEAYANFAKHWEADKLIGNLRRLNPNFYPEPVLVIRHPKPGIESQFNKMTEGFLTPEELISAHGRCGNLLHATNPFRKPINYDEYTKWFADLHQRIVSLLNFHHIRLIGESGFWHIQMGDFSTDQVTYNYFAPVTQKSSP